MGRALECEAAAAAAAAAALIILGCRRQSPEGTEATVEQGLPAFHDGMTSCSTVWVGQRLRGLQNSQAPSPFQLEQFTLLTCYINYDYMHLRSPKEQQDVRLTLTLLVRASAENHAVIWAQVPRRRASPAACRK
ncbi:Hypothetical predicted protein [Podarcis lilfordi]|uniref:Uncharacterized protein n=1 Tax=Podarcis lilfordi TaxID=74358 RepID=A0AA35KRJ1_9SAUR|nr:Hypothetical predicted protein [Podarcis lilfordi]